MNEKTALMEHKVDFSPVGVCQLLGTVASECFLFLRMTGDIDVVTNSDTVWLSALTASPLKPVSRRVAQQRLRFTFTLSKPHNFA